MPTPEQKARLKIDELLAAAGWDVQDRQSLNLYAGLRRAILKRAFEGRLVEQYPEDKPAEKLVDRIRRDQDAIKRDRVDQLGFPEM